MTRFVAAGERLFRSMRLGLCAAACLGAALPAPAADDPPAPPAGMRTRSAAEPAPRRGAQAAAAAAAAAGQAFADAPESPAVARALQRVAAEGGSPGEVYALITSPIAGPASGGS